jgi:leucyl aminopeptidase
LKLETTHKRLHEIGTDVLVIPMLEDNDLPEEIKTYLGDLIAPAIAAGDYRGEFGQTALFYTGGKVAARKVLLFGLGTAPKLDARRLRRAYGMAARVARGSGGLSIAFNVQPLGGASVSKVAQYAAEGVLHGLYRFETYKTGGKREPQVEQILFAAHPEIESGVTYGRAVAEGTNLARSLNWLPGNRLTAAVFGEKAQRLGQELGVEVEVHDKAGCQRLGLGLLLAVNQGSTEEPRFIVMRYKGGGGTGPWLGLVGKGVTFDTGGISIKPTESMWDMKYDMSGAGAVLGAIQAIAQLKPQCDVLAVIAATDNMPDGGSYKPGDVISGLSGKTVEVRSTDAEGRLILADGLAYAAGQGCQKLITASTLTGAAQIALGPFRFAVLANDEPWEKEVLQAAEEAGESGWSLPHDSEYEELFSSPIADMANSGRPRQAGTIVGGLFLMKHVGKTPCVHMDIAALAYKTATDKYEDCGATGAAVKTFVRAAFRFAEAN